MLSAELNDEYTTSTVVTKPEAARLINFSQFVTNSHDLHNQSLYYQLRNDLVQHLWS
ncbi:hypothetical protein VP01_3844g1 [Puccinia sorghi]|uniref:Uncharacterized protein n=1 Tax=Puccinia sorghi TaxID=27349 RepID=A0A0L6UV16_9BASI|nr:hypothetical protein VP01_3844g1 [Puccinia sorghi]